MTDAISTNNPIAAIILATAELAKFTAINDPERLAEVYKNLYQAVFEAYKGNQ